MSDASAPNSRRRSEAPAIPPNGRAHSKYKAIRTTVDGIDFHSKKEAKRFLELKLLERGGVIKGLELQPRYDLTINSVKCGFYKADFRYFQDGKRVVEDCKGFRTDTYRLKKKIIEALYSVEIKET